MSSMGITVRVYSVGSHQAEEIPLEAAAGRLDEGSIVWVDSVREDGSIAEVEERLGLGDAISSLASTPREGVSIRGHDIRLSVTGLRDVSGDAAAVRLDILLARNVVVSVHADPIRGLENAGRLAWRRSLAVLPRP